MGQRANLVIIRNSEWRLFYDHWCANRLDVELFWGPRLAAEFIEQRKPLEDRLDWLDEVWCEGGAVLDEDSKRLVWFGGEDIAYDIPLRRVMLDLMAGQWPGWEVRWAGGGIHQLGSYLDLPNALFSADHTFDERFQVLDEFPEDNLTLLTVEEEGNHGAARIYGDEEHLLAGISQLPTLLSLRRSSSLIWRGEFPQAGVHLAPERRTLSYWLSPPAENVEARMKLAWPSWRTVWLRDDFEAHLRLTESEVTLPQRSRAELATRVLEDIERRCHRPRRNPAIELSSRLAGAEIEINPWTNASRGSVGRRREKLGILHGLRNATR